MMGNTNITGRIPCRLFEEHEMKTVMFSVNKLEGDLPDCVLQVSNIHMWFCWLQVQCLMAWRHPCLFDERLYHAV